MKTEVYFNMDGYYIKGDLEISKSMVVGYQDPLKHLYFVCYAALHELLQMELDGTIIVYNDSRIIDEFNGLKALDKWNKEAISFIRRNILPSVKGVVFFHKQSGTTIDKIIRRAHSQMLDVVSEEKIRELLSSKYQEVFNTRKLAVKKFRESGFKRRNK